MGSLSESLNAIGRLQGREPIDPTIIQDLGAAPSNTVSPVEPSAEPIDFEPEYVSRAAPAPEPEDEEQASPLVALARGSLSMATTGGALAELNMKVIRTPEPIVELHTDSPALVVMGTDASYEGQQIKLDDEEEAAIASIVIKAIAKKVQDQHREVMARMAKRKRVKAAKPATPVVEAPKKRRGRPPKVKP